MPHNRKRHILSLFLKKLRFARVISIQGARQTGKSFFARHLVSQNLPHAIYRSLDQATDRRFANTNPDTFLKRFDGAMPLIIDEAQKAPDLFDAVKLAVDEDPKPGRFVLLGSTEFSREAKVRESLTGRLSKIRIYPLNLAESLEYAPNPSKKLSLLLDSPRVTRREFLHFVENGGFPGIFSVRDKKERETLLQDWLSLISQRDILQFSAAKPDPDLTHDILSNLGRCDPPDQTKIAKTLKVDPRKILKHLKLISQLFAIHGLSPHPLGSGKIRYFFCDPGIAALQQASFHTCLTTALILEQLSQHSYRGDSVKMSYYRSTRGGVIDLVLESTQMTIAIKVMETETLDLREFEILSAFKKKVLAQNPETKVSLIAWGPYARTEKLGDITLHPWESIG